MFKNYFKTAWRNLVKSKTFSLINITGLAIGLAACMLMILYVQHESSYDQFHKNADRIFWMQTKVRVSGDSLFMPYLPYTTAPAVAGRNPSVESFLRTRQQVEKAIIQNPQKTALTFAEPDFLFADSNFFGFFSFKLLQGNKQQVFDKPMSIVITERAARKYFGTTDVIGKTIRYNNAYYFSITGIAEDAPSNSTIKYDFVASLASLSSIKETQDLIKNERNDFTTYFTLKAGAGISGVENTLAQLAKEKENDAFSSRYIGIPLREYRQASGADAGSAKYLKIFSLVAALVLALALINYMSLSTARSSIRAKEIGVRKVMGASRSVIAFQFFIESFLYISIAFLLGYILSLTLQPFFFNFLQISIDQSFLYTPAIIVSFIVLLVVTIIISSVYPSLLLSAFKPVSVLYGKLAKRGNLNVRKFFTVFQFAIAVAFIICGIIIQKQIRYFRTADTGLDRENIVMIPFGENMAQHAVAFKQDASAVAGVQNSSIALHELFKGYDMMGVTPKETNKMILMPVLDVDQQFISLLGLKWKLPPTDTLFYKKKSSVLLNESAVEQLQLGQNPLNRQVDQFVVSGVVKDFNWRSLQYNIQPLFISVAADTDSSSLWAKKGGCLFAKIGAGTNIPGVIASLNRLYRKYDNENPFEYHFMDDSFDALYKSEDRLANLLSGFTVLAIMIACLGMFGLVTFMTMQRVKEIGIRKTLGASVHQIVNMLSVDFIRLVIAGVIIAMPVAWYCMHKWLENFAYRTTIEWWIFIIAAATAIVIAMFTIGLKTIRAAMANPVKSLRIE